MSMSSAARATRPVTAGDGPAIQGDETLSPWSMVFVDPAEDGFEIKAGRTGLEALVMQFPRDDD